MYREVAAEQVGDFKGDLAIVLREQCASPEFAGGSVTEFLSKLPHCTSAGKAAPTVDAFYAEKMLTDTRAALLEIVQEDRHTAEMLAEVHRDDVDVSESTDPDQPSQRELDRYIKKTTGGDQDAVDRAIRSERNASDEDVNASFRSTFAHRGEEDLDFSALPPSICYQEATRTLICGVLQECAGGDFTVTPRLQPLIEGGVLTQKTAQQICRHIRTLVDKLKFDSTGKVDAMD
ncbi:MAG: hypothetical protein PeribacterA2_0455 [Candidatus Peribacter riflensis]|uniref:Uncharacterized protein n=1 Tax=Candidatus Peribacter riflensis TaxID=1735162 RepID=A0A0S1SQB3_9BACT|nr:MAG: hypothetical protein PeribacterA2_0455 [Candidatus Peribacter riflensis]OGJ79266.1 MAG: hypothetical protein A2398_00415 [Candidatus Peribacteria bacterium RIFOXYB1_FULL_57_12]OGJ80944.1 MAG: hypothetical protein A2412_01115 [Candidatus Peribacteria bacterium RIFOXYC1_FULL_58_8]ALM10940.1 MAG: hypothetical protein PeribacterB2_0454 [Candidatus Peribacter riflensis]ALM12043.1 MAG: hypothetical protein PeribacterC2_0454 [Candidatus Peribacter riflensis]